MYLIQLLLPLYDNEGNHFSREVYDKVRDELTDYFGGATSFRRSPAEGVWEESGKIVFDEILIFEVMTSNLDRRWWQTYREDLQKRFRQDQLIIRATQFEQL